MSIKERVKTFFGDRVLLTQIILSLTSLVVRILLSPIDGYYMDIGCFHSWFYTASKYGVREFYQNVWCDYPPFNVFIFWVFGNLAKHLSLFEAPSLIYIIKLPSNLFDLAISYIIFHFLRKKMGDRWALMGAAFYSFNPSSIFNSSVWGQFDAMYTFFIMLSLTAILELKVKLSLASYALAVLSKPQALAFFPVLALFVLCKFDSKGIITALVSFFSTFIIFILPFKWGNPIDFILNLYLGGYGQYQYTSLNALNFWASIGLNISDAIQILPYLNYYIIGWTLFGAALVFILHYTQIYIKKLDSSSFVYSTFLVFFSFFMFLTRMHERYLFPAVALSVLSLVYSKKLQLISIAVTLTSLFNQAYALKFLNKGMFIHQTDPLVYIVSSFNLVILFYCYYLFIKRKD